MVQCFVAECDHSYSKNQCSFFRLPSNTSTRRKWEQLCGRTTDCSNENSRICSCHFIDGLKSAAPSVFQWSQMKRTCFTPLHPDLKREPEEKVVMCATSGNDVSLRSTEEEMMMMQETHFKQERREMEITQLQTI